LTQKRRDLLVAAIALLCLGPAFAVITGVCFMAVAGLTGIMFLAQQYRQGMPQWLVRQLPVVVPIGIMLAMFILMPQFFTFWGRTGYLHWRQYPVLWFSKAPIHNATLYQWKEFGRILFLELGPVLYLGLIATPFCLWKTRKSSPYFCFLILSLLILIVVSELYVEAQTLDWQWRSGGLAIIILCPLVATWLFNHWMPRRAWMRIPYWLAALALLAPSIFNFYSELRIRHRNCNAPPSFLADINSNIDLHTATGFTTFDPNLIFFAGRIGVGPNNPSMLDLHVYSLPLDKLHATFGWSGNTYTCGSTWYGASIPNETYVKFIRAYPFAVELAHCPQRK